MTDSNEIVLDYGDRGRVIVTPDGRAMARAAAQLLADVANTAQQERRIAAVALSGGSTPKAMGALLAHEPLRSQVAWDHLLIYWGDERWVPLADGESNAGEAKRGYLDHVGIPARNVVPFPFEGSDPEASAAAIEASIRERVAGTPVPQFDLILLGMGDDGHTASLFPGTDAIQEHERMVLAHHVEKLDSVRLTFSPLLINAAKQVVFLVGGAGKANTLQDVLDGGVDVDRLPSQVVRPAGGQLTWLVDRAAAAELERLAPDA